jgi:hypothetical protein
MRLWPKRARRRGPDPGSMLPAPTVAPQVTLPSAPDSQPPQSPERPFERPDKLIGLLSDLTRDRKQGYTFLIITGGVLIMVMVCFVGGSWAIAEASKGFKGFPLRAVVAGVPSAAFMAFLTSRIVRWIKRIVQWIKKIRKSSGGPSSG